MSVDLMEAASPKCYRDHYEVVRVADGKRQISSQRADTLNEARATAAKMASGSRPPLLVVEFDFRQQTEKFVVDPDCVCIEVHRILNMRERVFTM